MGMVEIKVLEMEMVRGSTPSGKGRLNAEGALEVDELESEDVERRASELPVSTTCNVWATSREI